MEFYEFTQNNSGGSVDSSGQLCHRLFIEADGERKATKKAKDLGVYFNGINKGTDCGCCGDRWTAPDKIEIPYRFGTFSKEEAEKYAKVYNAEFGPTTWGFLGGDPDPDRCDIVFNDVESYAQFLADRWGRFMSRVGVDARVFYDDGRVVEIIPQEV